MLLPVTLGDRPSFVLLVRRGVTFQAVEFYFREKGEEPPDPQFELTQTPFTRGTSTYVRSHNGKSVKVRSLGADGELKLTTAGKRFYSQLRRSTSYQSLCSSKANIGTGVHVNARLTSQLICCK